MPILNTRRLSVSLTATLALCLFPVITPAAGVATPAVPAAQVTGAAGTHHYAIPRQPLYSALDTLAEQAGLQLVYSAELVQALDSPGVTGNYTPEDALTRLLAGTGLTYRYTGPGTVTLQRPDPLEALVAEAKKSRQYAEAAEPAPKESEASPPKKNDAGATELPEMTVTASPVDDTSYTVPNASSATKTDTPIMETPYSIQVVPQQVMEDVQAIELNDALDYVSGVYRASGSGDAFEVSRRRGFASFPQGDYRDGFPFPLANIIIGGIDLANTERVEVLKGPASLLYGMTIPGGIVNFVTKKPLATPYYSLQQQFGSFGLYRTTVDATGPITQDDTLLYRFNLAYKSADSFRDFVDSERSSWHRP